MLWPPMTLQTGNLRRCIRILESAYEALQERAADEMLYDIYRAACVKEFELVLEQSGKLLRKRSAPGSPATGRSTASSSRTCSGLPPSTAGKALADAIEAPEPAGDA